jgi:hypothetical protein
MASNIKIKRSEVAGNPTTLGAGELAYSALPDTGSNGGDRLYIGMGTETDGNAVNHFVIGGKYFTDAINAATDLSTGSTIVKRNAGGNFSAGTITATLIGTASSANKWQTARSLSLTGDATASIASLDGSADTTATITLATVNSNTGSFGSSTQVPVVTVNAKGLVTGVTLVDVAQAGAGTANLTITGNTGTDTVSTGIDTLNFAGGTGVTTAVTNNQVSFAIGQNVATDANVNFNNLTLAGNLVVNGTTTSVNSTTVEVSDLNITVAKGSATAAVANGAGLTVDGAGATLIYTSANDRWNFNKDLSVATVYGALSGNASTATKWATARNLSLSGDATATLESVDGSAAVSSTITLATVNTNTGSFGSGTSVPSFTVNAKGLITAASATAISIATSTVLGLASFASADFTVTAGAVSIKAIDGGIYG